MKDHSDKLRCIGDFSGLEFGITFDEETERVLLRYPTITERNNIKLYPNYNEDEFRSKSFIEKLDWMYEYCEFIPYRLALETIFIDGYQSHKYSHIKKDSYAMKLLEKYLNNGEYEPKDDIYYYIKYSKKTSSYYLKRDLVKSPRKNK